MTTARRAPARGHVFLNVPFDAEYAPLFVALIAGLTALGRTPHCVLEVPSSGRSRVERLYRLIARCDASIHDVSRVTLSGSLNLPRFNMPFELGVAYALAHQKRGTKRHRFFVLEERPFRIDASLSDLKGFDPYIHQASQKGILAVLLDCLGSKASPELDTLEALTARLAAAIDRLQRKRGASDPFQPDTFRRAVFAGTAFARAAGLIR